MEIKSFKKEKGNKYKILFKDNSDIILYDDIIVKYNLLVNKNLTKENFEKIVAENSNLDAYYIALKYLNSKMRTKLEIKKYLEKKEFSAAIIETTLKKLEQNKIIDESLYIKAYIHDQIQFNKIGPNKILNKLYDLGIAKEISKVYLEEIPKNVWKEKLEKQIDKKIKSNKSYSASLLKNKIVTSFYNEGYEKSMIIDILSKKEICNTLDVIIKEYKKQKKKLEKKYDGEALDYQLKMKLFAKGFSKEEIDKVKTGM